MSIGKELRLQRIFDKNSKRTVIITLDHAIAHGVQEGIRDIEDTIEKVVAGEPNCITIHKGLVRKFYKKFMGKISLILKVSSFSPYHPSYDVFLTSVEEALSYGADAIALGASVGDSRQDLMLKRISKLSKECEHYGMPLTVHIYPKGDMIKEEDRYKTENIMYAARVASELGADIVKTWYTGSIETFREVVKACPVPIVIAGGPKAKNLKEFFIMVKGAMEAGASGVAIGRNVWGSKNPTLMVKALKSLIHDGYEVEQVLKEFTIE
ncbi:MAG: 2-amino-3,7-dideoxy-D-threo-hept-6-ulosonate synthase [Nitrososphaerales archaeon]